MSVLGQQLIATVRAKAAENPDFVYETPLASTGEDMPPCVYVHNGCPSCLVGHALFDAGEIDASLEASAKNSMGFAGLVDQLGLELDTDEWNWLRQVQRYQDSHKSWGEAVKRTDADALRGYKSWNVA